jgi:hypothetical protein
MVDFKTLSGPIDLIKSSRVGTTSLSSKAANESFENPLTIVTLFKFLAGKFKIPVSPLRFQNTISGNVVHPLLLL